MLKFFNVICVWSLGPHLFPQEYKDGRVGDDGDDERHVERTQGRVRLRWMWINFPIMYHEPAHFVALLLEILYFSSGTKIGEREGKWNGTLAFTMNLLGNTNLRSYLIFGSII